MAAESGNSESKTVVVVDPIDKYSVFIVRVNFLNYFPKFQCIQGAIIGTGILGLALIARNSGLFTKFQHVSRIPKEFYVKGRELNGVVREVGQNGLLKVEHYPIISLPSLFFRKKVSKNVSLCSTKLFYSTKF